MPLPSAWQKRGKGMAHGLRAEGPNITFQKQDLQNKQNKNCNLYGQNTDFFSINNFTFYIFNIEKKSALFCIYLTNQKGPAP